MANLALGRMQAAEAEFGRMLDAGLDRGKLAVKFVFRPASIQFWPDRTISGPYPMWLREIALHSAERSSCLRIVGHTSPTGVPEINDALSKHRADFVRTSLIRRAPQLRQRTEALGRGSSEPIVGTGRDDATDVLDRRVEFVPFNCMRAGA
jgi:outer membrane protein OmpA-like peptidoglycan-associated protein